MLTLSADPGSTTGAAVLLEGETVTDWWTWTWLKAKGGRYRVRSSYGDLEVPSMHQVATTLAPPAVDLLVVEGLYAPGDRSKVATQSIVPLAESAGELLGPLRGLAPEVLRPLASVWRRQLLGLPPDMGAKQAEEYAVSWAQRALSWAVPYDRWALTYAEGGALCEAACMGVWGQRR